MKHIYLFSLLFLLSLNGIKAANIFSNPGFESGQDWWGSQVTDGSATVDYNSSDAHSGNYSAHFNVLTPGDNNWNIQLNTPSNWAAEKGAKYIISFYAKADKDVSIHLAAQDGPPFYNYRTGSNYTLNSDWKLIEMVYTSDAEGEGALRFNIFVGASAANYYFDDFNLEIIPEVELGTPVPPTQGAYYTDLYRNMFKEMGKSETAIDNKVEAAFQQLFYGSSTSEALYFETGSDMAYIDAISSKDIRSEGMSYGMMIAVQLDKKEEFDKLWKFAKTYMQHKTGPRAGYFAWQVDASTFEILDPNSASDGEEYFATALFFAAHRWGNGEGIFNYEAEAQQLLSDMINLETRNGGVVNQLTNMFNKTNKQVVFVPEGGNADFTDPSYHLPAFYKLWSLWASTDNQFWADAADSSKLFLLKAMHPNTGLVTDYMTFDGQPYTVSWNSNAGNFAYDSWRVISNIAMDAHWFGNSWHSAQVDKLLTFFNSYGSNYNALYHQDGTPTENTHAASGLYAMNGAGTLASNNAIAWDFVDKLYNQAVPTGEYRYYDGLLHILALLHASGKFKIWKPETVTSNVNALSSTVKLMIYPNPSPSGKINLSSDIVQEGSFEIRDISGRTLHSGIMENGKAEVSVTTLKEGIYFVNIKDAKNIFTEKVIIK
ncbi:glycoside hydrolase [Sporocytophaga myxococcoides]|uniref:cellulase n=1 Tax=Sporocytophaga myxococcoides TaxID=153721 RepID=A0A098LL42_9BACT|nr:glycosyl hydrolase family 8 [Sporocytophaga myxococcoides]GAL87117.1 glycoside hydrolase [Sporocytophaga myxococcoides]